MQYSVTSMISVNSRVELIMLTFCISIMTYYFVENPVRRSPRLDRRPSATFVMAAALILLVWAETGFHQHFVVI
jgi:peptidoglycan/LPS O-acetylase OafA/YrhL